MHMKVKTSCAPILYCVLLFFIRKADYLVGYRYISLRRAKKFAFRTLLLCHSYKKQISTIFSGFLLVRRKQVCFPVLPMQGVHGCSVTLLKKSFPVFHLTQVIVYIERRPRHDCTVGIYDKSHALFFRGMRKRQFGSPKSQVVFESLGVAAVAPISEERTLYGRHLHAYLM